jgi:hypothetical protein
MFLAFQQHQLPWRCPYVWTSSNATGLALKGVLSLQMKISAGLTRSRYVVIVLMSHSNGNPGICWLHPVLQSVEIIIQFDDHCLSHIIHLLLLDLFFNNWLVLSGKVPTLFRNSQFSPLFTWVFALFHRVLGPVSSL